MDEMIELRCKYCGAPLDRGSVESEAQYVTCPYCGTTQQRVDAKAYMDQMMAQIKSWIGKAIPGGFSLSQTDNVDPIARHNIFVNNHPYAASAHRRTHHKFPLFSGGCLRCDSWRRSSRRHAGRPCGR